MNRLLQIIRRFWQASEPSMFAPSEPQDIEPIPSIVRRQGPAQQIDEFNGWRLEFELQRYRDDSQWWADLLRMEGNCDA